MNKKEQIFIDTVLSFYRAHGRHTLPWRQNTDPYQILVSELMLQQTQVERVIPKFESFVKKWPQVQLLAKSSLAEVLREWQGLGYNRRAKFLWECARQVVSLHGGKFPKSYDGLLTLPGIGPYTAGAIMAFAYNTPVPIIETNIRTVFIHHFFAKRSGVTDVEIMKCIIKTLPEKNVREWYAALMDYGSHLKRTVGNRNVQSRSYTTQPTFKGSDRQIRGAIVRALSHSTSLTQEELTVSLSGFPKDRVQEQINSLLKDGLVVMKRRRLQLPS